MRLPVSLAVRLMPQSWRETFETLRALCAVDKGRLAAVGALHVSRTLTEAFGIVMILPILQYIEEDGNVAVLTEKWRIWRVIVGAYDVLGVPVDLYTLSATVFVLILLRQVSTYAALVATERLKEIVAARLRTRVFHEILGSGAQFLKTLPTGHFVSLVHQHAHVSGSALRNMLTVGGLYLTFAVYGVILAAMAPVATALCAAFGLVVIRLMRRYAEMARQINKLNVLALQDFAQFLTERFRAWRLIKLAGTQSAEDHNAGLWAQKLADLVVRNTEMAARVQLYVTPLVALFALGGLLIAVDVLTLGLADITLFVIVLLRLLPLLNQFLALRHAHVQFAASLGRVRTVLDQAHEAHEIDDGTLEFTGLAQAIAFEDVEFRYGAGERSALRDVSITIPARRTTAITGPSGAGKSTLVDLIPRLIQPDSGRMLIDGRPAGDYTLASLRRRIAFVPQQPLLFDASVVDNVRYARPAATIEEVREACRLAHAEEFIAQMPDGYETRLGEYGSRLSAGQKQRLALAQAFLAEASILILDEPTSALDYESERYIQQALAHIRTNREVTIIVIAHRLSTIRTADHLVVLMEGGVFEQGSPDQLRHSESWYARMLGLESHGAQPAA